MHTFSKNFDPLFVLVWVNSKLFQYTYECFFDALRMAGRFLPFTAPYLTIMCIKGNSTVSTVLDGPGDQMLIPSRRS